MSDEKAPDAVDGAAVEALPPAPATVTVRGGDRLRLTLPDGRVVVHEVDARGAVELPLAELARVAGLLAGGRATLALPDGRVLDVALP